MYNTTAMDKIDHIATILESFWPHNKAKGLYAQTTLVDDAKSGALGRDAKDKLFNGCWFFAPKGADYYRFRFSFFIHPVVRKTGDSVAHPKELLGDKYRPFHAIAEFLKNTGIGVVYVVTTTENGQLPLDAIQNRTYDSITWMLYTFENGDFVSRNANDFFAEWAGNRGRATVGKGWEPKTRNIIKSLDEDVITDLLLHELFMTGYVKGVLKKPVNDPYDIDSILLSISQKHIFPMEIKEKFPGQNGPEKFFGIDAGRIMMLLRVCVPNDANAIYLIREVEENTGRFVAWKYMLLSDIIMTSGWNLQSGGRGMGGQDTQTVKLPYKDFRIFDAAFLEENNLKLVSSLPNDVKKIACNFESTVSKRFY